MTGTRASCNLPPLALAACALCVLAILGTAFALGMSLGQAATAAGSRSRRPRTGRRSWRSSASEIADLKQQMQERVDAIAMRLGDMNAHVIRLDALGKRLTAMAGIESREFDFGHDPPQGGPEGDIPGREAADSRPLDHAADLEGQVDLSDSQLSALENVILARQLKQEIHPEGRPVSSGFISSVLRRAGRSLHRRRPNSTRASISRRRRGPGFVRWPQAS